MCIRDRLYRIGDDPDETENLYDDPRHRETRERMVAHLLDRLIHSESPRHGESKRGAAYWRYLYSRAFEGDG